MIVVMVMKDKGDVEWDVVDIVYDVEYFLIFLCWGLGSKKFYDIVKEFMEFGYDGRFGFLLYYVVKGRIWVFGKWLNSIKNKLLDFYY